MGCGFFEKYPPYFSDGKSMEVDVGAALSMLDESAKKLKSVKTEKPIKKMEVINLKPSCLLKMAIKCLKKFKPEDLDADYYLACAVRKELGLKSTETPNWVNALDSFQSGDISGALYYLGYRYESNYISKINVVGWKKDPKLFFQNMKLIVSLLQNHHI